MKQTIGFYEFQRAFEAMRPDNFSRNGLVALFDYLTELEEDTGEEFELDVIAFCCEFSEYENIEEFQNDFGDEYKTFDDIQDKTQLFPIDGTDGFIIQRF